MRSYDPPREVFVIVVEVDHLRARAAYRKGMDDLQEIWPAVMQYAEKLDAESAERAIKRREERAKEQAAYHEGLLAYQKDMVKWQAAIFKGPMPSYPLEPLSYYSWDYPGSSQVLSYQTTMSTLKAKLELAEAAQGPFKMTEHDVASMIAWENGTRVADIKKAIT